MLQALSPQQLTLRIDEQALGFGDTSQLIGKSSGWVGQSRAEKAAKFGLSLQQSGFHLLVLGESGSGRAALMLTAMREAASRQSAPNDLVFVNNFHAPEKPVALALKAGYGAKLKEALEQLIQNFAKSLPGLLPEMANNPSAKSLQKAELASIELSNPVIAFVQNQMSIVANLMANGVMDAGKFEQFLSLLKADVLENIEVFQPATQNESSNDGDNAMEALLSRYRANLLVDNRHLIHADAECAPVIYDDDPSFQSLFGAIESSSDNAGIADFMRLRAGNLLKANGGMLMLHLRDIQSDQQSGQQILEKLHRFLRNHRVHIEESAGTSGHSISVHLMPEALSAEVKVVLITTHEEYYQLQEEMPELARFFRIKVDFSPVLPANKATYEQFAIYIAERCQYFGLKHFSMKAVARLLLAMHRLAEDQSRISTHLAELEGLVLESAAMAHLREAMQVDIEDVEAAIAAKQARHQQPEDELHSAILDGELMINLQGSAVGQVNGLTHIDLGDSSFGSPVRISARCYAGEKGIINIDREVEMTGPNHDKGLFILQSWLSASFAYLTPLSLSASLVFEQEYHGVEGDSASCAELYALLSALSGMPVKQGVAVTGALNQHGEVMPVGGLNEKIEGFFKLCKAIGLDGSHGVVIPSVNQPHLLLDNEVIHAVEQGLFHIHGITHVLDGMEYLTGMPAGTVDGVVAINVDSDPNTVMAQVQTKLEAFHQIHRRNHVVSPNN